MGCCSDEFGDERKGQTPIGPREQTGPLLETEFVKMDGDMIVLADRASESLATATSKDVAAKLATDLITDIARMMTENERSTITDGVSALLGKFMVMARDEHPALRYYRDKPLDDNRAVSRGKVSVLINDLCASRNLPYRVRSGPSRLALSAVTVESSPT
jgi:hypothetical protein